MISRMNIINRLTETLKPMDCAYALWLEGADALNQVDSYSDLDFWLDFEDSHEEDIYKAVEDALQSLSPLDLNHTVEVAHPKLRKRVYHLEGTSEYLRIDFNFQLHSRGDLENFSFYRKDIVENAKVLFDKAKIVQFSEIPKRLKRAEREQYLGRCDYRFKERTRVVKYLMRGEYLECVSHYYEYVIEPVVVLLRLLYTPGYPEHHLAHISRQLPEPERRRLERLLKISSLSDIERNLKEAEALYYRLRHELAPASSGRE